MRRPAALAVALLEVLGTPLSELLKLALAAG
jgi:hypothetical protein